MSIFKSRGHSGFHVFCLSGTYLKKRGAWPPAWRVEPIPRRENLVRYIVRASISQDRMTYLPDKAKVLCRSKDNRIEKTFDALGQLV
jgi:hypothetical protein